MSISLGVKSDPILYRYSFEWLFRLMHTHGVRYLQLGTFFELYSLPDSYFLRLRDLAERYEVSIRSCFTAHRELGGFFSTDSELRAVADRNYRRLIEIGALLGAESVGSNPGAILRDMPGTASAGEESFLSAMTRLATYAARVGVQALTIEPMSSRFEPPSFPEEIDRYMTRLAELRDVAPEPTVPVYLCSDVSHGVADSRRVVTHDNMMLFEYGLPWMWEFHLKNTDEYFNSTFGFGPAERDRGIVDLAAVRDLVHRHGERLPRKDVVAYLEINGPKTGRDYTDFLLEKELNESLEAITDVFKTPAPTSHQR
jgi:sugar phosphate isomerase/epimerase